MAYMRDDQRVELALPGALYLALLLAKPFGVPPELEGAEREEALAEMAKTEAHLRDLVLTGTLEALTDLPKRKAESLFRRALTTCKAAIAVHLEGQTHLKIAMSLYYLIQDLLETETLSLVEGSPMAEAIAKITDLAMDGFSVDKLDRSAQKTARRLLDALQSAGYYKHSHTNLPLAA